MTTARMRAVAFKEFELSNNLKNLNGMYEARQNKEKVSRRIDAIGSGTRQRVNIKNCYIMSSPSKCEFRPIHQLRSNKFIFQLKPLNVYEKQQLASIKQSCQIFQEYSFISFIVKYINETQKDEYNIKNEVDEIENFLNKLIQLYEEAHVSSEDFHKFKAKYNFYINSGYRNKLLNVKYKMKHKDNKDFLRKHAPERNELTKITISDELYFQEYIKKQKAPQVVFRGDGRNLNIENFQIGTIQAEGNPDISFYGVVEHTHTNTAKNGMISTTTDEEQAKDWATGGGKRNGVVYKIILDNYIDVDKLLSNRNFKNRYQGQKEIMSLGDIEVSKILSAIIYDKDKQIINIYIPAI